MYLNIMLTFYVIGCILAYFCIKDIFTDIRDRDKGYFIVGIACSWITVALMIYNKYFKS